MTDDAPVILHEITLPDGLTIEQAIEELAALRPGTWLVDPHRILTARLAPPTGQPAEPARSDPADRVGPGPDRITDSADRVGSDADRLADPPPLALAPGPSGSDPAQPALAPVPPTYEAVALLIGELNGRPVTADQLRVGLRIGPDKSRELRDFVNAELFPQRGQPRDG